jgi:UDP-N-acetylmuramoylalanine--D-glutamate ligase
MRFAELESRDVAIWGLGREGRAALAALRRRFPDKSLTLYCKHEEAEQARAQIDSRIRVVETAPGTEALASHGIVIKSPGISTYKPEIIEAQKRGTRFTSGTALWFGENSDARVIVVTGTKGKSTTTAMIAHCARSLGIRTALAGNIGMPLLELDGQEADLWAIELSSFQTGDAGPVEVGVVVSLEEEHLDWHGTRERYIADKLKLADVSRALLMDAQSPLLMQYTAAHPHRVTFCDAQGWHVSESSIWRGSERIFDLSELPLAGEHNARNACAALGALELFGLDARAAAPALRTFKPLPHRLQRLGIRNGIEWIDDSIATTPAASLAALRSTGDRAATLILGGFDRGLDWDVFARELAAHPPHTLVVQGANAARILEALACAAVPAHVERSDDFENAVARAAQLTPPGGVVLLSPGAPSFDRFKDYAERGRAFATLAGFGGAALGEIEGLGIA